MCTFSSKQNYLGNAALESSGILIASYKAGKIRCITLVYPEGQFPVDSPFHLYHMLKAHIAHFEDLKYRTVVYPTRPVQSLMFFFKMQKCLHPCIILSTINFYN